MVPRRGDHVIYFDGRGVPRNALVIERTGDHYVLVVVEEDAADPAIVRDVPHQDPAIEAPHNRWAWPCEIGF